MKFHRCFHKIIPLILLILIAGCSGGKAPIITGDLNAPVGTVDSLSVAVSDISADGKITGGAGVLGLYQVNVDTNTLQGELVPLRSSASKDVLEIVDITSFLTVAPCSDCVVIRSIGIDSRKHLVMNIGIKHPFPAGDSTEAPSGLNRADLHVFNVEGTVIGNSASPFEFTGLGETIDTFRLFNADGYSAYLDPSLESFIATPATIHPYIVHFDDYGAGNFDPESTTGFTSVTEPHPSGNLVMPMGSGYDYKDYVFASPAGGTLNFIFAVGCSFGLSASSFDQRLTPEYRVPQFNKKAASEVDVKVTEWNFISGDTSSTVKLQVRVTDINHGVAVGDGLDEMAFDSSVKQIDIDVPGFMTAISSTVDPVAISGTGKSPSNPLVYEITLTNTAGGTASTYPALVKVIDSYPPASNTNALLTGKDGLSRVVPGQGSILDGLFEITEFATYLAFILQEPGIEPTCAIVTDPTILDIQQGAVIEFDGSTSTDDGTIDIYEWDFDYDGSNFVIDETGAVVNGYICEPGTHDVALRITDNDQNSVICTVTVTVTEDTGAIDGWGTDKKLVASGALEPVISNTSNRAMATYRNELYIVMNSNLPTDKSENIYFMRSPDMGLTWDTPVKVTSYPDADQAWTREANIAVDRNTGGIYIQFQSDWKSFHDTTFYKFDVYASWSLDRGKTWADPVRVNDDVIGESNQYAGSIAIKDSSNPAQIFIAYENRATANDFNIHVATASTSNPTTWTNQKIDTDATKSMHPSIYVNPNDQSINVAWVNPKNLGGLGQVLFDRSTDGATWGDNVVVYTFQSGGPNYGPFETCLAIEPVNGIPAVLWREVNTGNKSCLLKFAKADNIEGTTWGTPYQFSKSPNITEYCWSGTLDVSSSGRWVAVFEQDKDQDDTWKAMFTESTDGGTTWTTPVQIDDSSWVFGISMLMDACNTVHVIWGDERLDQAKNELYYDFGS